MASLSASGIGSGLDIQSIVGQLMDVERQPLQRLQIKQFTLEAQISAYGQLSSSLSSFQAAMDKLGSVSALKLFSATSTNSDVVTVTPSSDPDLGTFGVEVVRIAEQHKMATKEIQDTTTIGGRRSDDALNIQVGNDPADTLTVDLSTAKTLEEIRTAINEDPSNPGVSAMILNGDNGKQKLVLTSENTGTENALTISTAGRVRRSHFGFQTLNHNGGSTNLLDAEINVDGYNITRPNNEISDVIRGATLNLVSADPGNTHSVEIGRDSNAVKQAVQSFADAFNQLRSQIRAFRDGQLGTDSVLLSIERQVFSVLNSRASAGAYGVLSEVGLTMQKDGTMTLDSGELDAALAADLDSVAQLFGADGDGFANRLAGLAEGWLGSGGLIDARQDGLRSSVNDLIDRQAVIERNLETVEARYLAQFTALDTLVAQLQNTSQFLTNQLAQLPTANQINKT